MYMRVYLYLYCVFFTLPINLRHNHQSCHKSHIKYQIRLPKCIVYRISIHNLSAGIHAHTGTGTGNTENNLSN